MILIELPPESAEISFGHTDWGDHQVTTWFPYAITGAFSELIENFDGEYRRLKVEE